jgi:hypothetical protein
MSASAAQIRAASDVGADRMTDTLIRAFDLWRDPNYALRREAIAAIARSAGYSVAMLENSIDALLKPFTRASLTAMAARMSASRRSHKTKTVGFIMAGNVAGAGIHEVVMALLAAARVVIKTASAEPIFFAEFARTIAEIDRDAGARIEVLNWGRGRADLTAKLIENCDLVAAYGDDETIESLRRPNLIGFGSRVSAAVVALEVCDSSRIEQVANLLARDVALFEQLGCLSPHQIFAISSDDNAVRGFAARIATALERIGESMPPARIPLRDAAEIRGVRERARWRAIAGEPIELFEGRRLDWTLTFERRSDASEPLKISPGFRTVHVTAVRDLAEFVERIGPVSPRIEAMAVAGDESSKISRALAAMRIPYVCAPGEMQSPPLDWRHGGGAFIDAMVSAR